MRCLAGHMRCRCQRLIARSLRLYIHMQCNSVHHDPLHWARTGEKPPPVNWSANADVHAGRGDFAAHSLSDGALVETGASFKLALPRERGVLEASCSSIGSPLRPPNDVELSWRQSARDWRICKPAAGPPFCELHSGGTTVQIDGHRDVCITHHVRLASQQLCTCRVRSTLMRNIELSGEMRMLGATWGLHGQLGGPAAMGKGMKETPCKATVQVRMMLIAAL